MSLLRLREVKQLSQGCTASSQQGNRPCQVGPTSPTWPPSAGREPGPARWRGSGALLPPAGGGTHGKPTQNLLLAERDGPPRSLITTKPDHNCKEAVRAGRNPTRTSRSQDSQHWNRGVSGRPQASVAVGKQGQRPLQTKPARPPAALPVTVSHVGDCLLPLGLDVPQLGQNLGLLVLVAGRQQHLGRPKHQVHLHTPLRLQLAYSLPWTQKQVPGVRRSAALLWGLGSLRTALRVGAGVRRRTRWGRGPEVGTG